MSLISSISNYGGKQPNNTAYVKQFVSSVGNFATWIYSSSYNQNRDIKTITPTDSFVDVLVKNDLIVLGSIKTALNDEGKENISAIDPSICDNLILLEPKQYNYTYNSNEKHFGFLEKDIQELFPNLINNFQIKQGEPFTKTIDYIELIPLLLLKIQSMQKEIDELKKNNK